MMSMARPCERRLWTLIAVVAATYTLSCLLYTFLDREQSPLLLRPAALWWKSDAQPYNMTLLDGKNDMEWLIDLPDFHFLINNKRCDGEKDVFLMVFVHSAPTNFRKRQVIRETWGSESNLIHDPMRVVFLLGTVADSEVQHRIQEENEIYHDIVQGTFEDSYRNLTYKHVMGLKWVTYFCRQARFVFKSDDDIFVDIFQLTSFLKDTFGQTGGVANLIMCYLVHSPHVKRSQRSKWRVSFREYPFRKYPTYCSGWGVLMSPDVVFKLYLLSSKVPYFWIDDVHITGTLASRLGISHVDFSDKLDLTSVNMDKWLNSEHLVRPFLFGYPDSDAETIFALWNRTMQYYSNKVTMNYNR
ncbi:beta-1,3-galactosyltransferase 5-like [Uloborus diversus]|uniref:beta-1,3-galactosyltransferase 5-like n=1 Tax=Uloborus diversus TaxID=327109 RepID=UPI00240A965B|nr:beta-1,3-galactosyltransferase 5-like [Uloborus diversus]XP_054718030.1 beta-1,3-galactosyltransferase 5-like [Uloborus diversus]